MKTSRYGWESCLYTVYGVCVYVRGEGDIRGEKHPRSGSTDIETADSEFL